MSFIGKLSTFLSESHPAKFLNYVLDFAKPLRYVIEDIFEFMFGRMKTKNTRRLLFCIGFSVLFYKIGQFLYKSAPVASKFVTHFYYRYTFNRLEFKERYGANCWALITGFTEGIGYSFAQELAKLKYNLVLVGRNKTKIQYTLRWLRQTYPNIEVRVIELDFIIPPGKLSKEIAEKTSDLDIGIVINNVGVAHGGMFADIERQKLEDTFVINVNSMVEINKIFIQRFRQRVNRSAIINLSSCTGIYPSPRVGLYSFTKVYLDVFSRIITKECLDLNVDVLTYRPFGVSTPMMGMRKGPLMITPRNCAETAIYQLGYRKRSCGGLKHKLSELVFANMSEQARFDQYNDGFTKVQENIKKGK